MKKKLLIKNIVYYLLGSVTFIVLAFVSQRITVAVLRNDVIDPIQDFLNIKVYAKNYLKYYILVYTVIYFVLKIIIKKYDKFIVRKLNEKLENMRKDDSYGER